MIDYKTNAEINIMKKGGLILSDVLNHVLSQIRPGMSEAQIDSMAELQIKENQAEPGFQKVEGYVHSICVSTNDIVVHGIPGKYVFKNGDVIGVDCGVFLNGFHTDMSETVRLVNGVPRFYSGTDVQDGDETDRFLNIGKYALSQAIEVAVIGNRIGHISQTIQRIVEKDAGYSIVRSLIGHGVGRDLHEEPEVPGYLNKAIEKTVTLKEGMTIAIEIIYNMGSGKVIIDRDGWTIRTQDHSLSGLYERTIAITQDGPVILTP
jgi:methionyl aminopeptidase